MNRFVAPMLSCFAFIATAHCGGSSVNGDGAVDVATDAGADAQGNDVPSSDAPVVDVPVGDVAPPPDGGGRVPLYHRADNSQCLTTPPAGGCPFGGGGGPSETCQHDSECTAGVNGRCTESTGGPLEFCMCTYDTCTMDSQCSTGGPCACHGSGYLGGGGNGCVPGNCQVDANCGAGGYCSPSIAPESCGGLGGYYCHTPSDTCIDDSDCAGATGGPQICVYESSSAHWQCAPQLECA